MKKGSGFGRALVSDVSDVQPLIVGYLLEDLGCGRVHGSVRVQRNALPVPPACENVSSLVLESLVGR